MGHVVGDTITVSAPAGDLHFTILSLKRKTDGLRSLSSRL